MGLERIHFKEVFEFAGKLRHIIWFIIIAFIIIFFRLFELQIVRGEKFKGLSDSNSIRLIPQKAPRGIIFDRNGSIIVRNGHSFSVSVIPADFLKQETNLNKLSQLLNIPREEIEDKLKEVKILSQFRPIGIKENLSREMLARIAEHESDLPGVMLQQETQRFYKTATLAPHVIGYVGLVDESEVVLNPEQYMYGDIIGRTGIEKVYDQYLRGRNGYTGIRVNALGRELGVIFKREHVKGKDIILTIDKDIQEAAEKELKNKKGSIIVMNPKNGEVLAMASSPAFDLGSFNDGGISIEAWDKIVKNEGHPLQNKAISAQYPMGSTFKPIVAIAGLEKNLINTETEVTCTGRITYKDQTFRCWEDKGHGVVNLFRGLSESCDVYFYYLGLKVRVDNISDFSSLFGLGQITGIDINGEEVGLVPTPVWKEKNRGAPWYPGNTIQLAIGQSYMLATPIQMLQVFNILANEGKLYQPHLLKSIVTDKGQEEMPYKFIKNVELSKNLNTWKIIKKALWEVVHKENGTGRAVKINGLDICGKTASIQNPHGKEHASFIAFAPMSDPEVSVIVFIEYGEKGGQIAAPIARIILQTWAKKYYWNQKKPA